MFGKLTCIDSLQYRESEGRTGGTRSDAHTSGANRGHRCVALCRQRQLSQTRKPTIWLTTSPVLPPLCIAQTDSRAYSFLEPLGGSAASTIPSSAESRWAASSTGRPAKRSRALMRISDASGDLQFTRVKGSEGDRITAADLESKDIFLCGCRTSMAAHRTPHN